MSKLRVVSIDLTEITKLFNAGHSAFSKSDKNGHNYVSLAIWDKDELDKFKQDVSVKLNPVKDKKDAEGNNYVGNGRKIESGGSQQQTQAAPAHSNEPDLPF